jgi:acetyltransferase-like isoleucine patch superfamily enzyme
MVISLWKLLGRRGRPEGRSLADADENTARMLRRRGAKIGKGCRIYSYDFSTEPYLIELADGVAVAGGVKFLTHDGSVRLLRHRRPGVQHFGRIFVGTDSFIGENAIILPGTTIGAYCIVAAGAVVRGTIPDNSLVVGNPATVVGRASTYLERLNVNRHTLDTFGMDASERRAAILGHFEMEPSDASSG